MTTKPRCVHHSSSFWVRGVACYRDGVFVDGDNGQWWCQQHAPPEVMEQIRQSRLLAIADAKQNVVTAALAWSRVSSEYDDDVALELAYAVDTLLKLEEMP